MNTKLDYLAFAFYFSIHKIFRFHAKTQPGILTPDEFKQIYDNPKMFNEKFKEYTDSIEFEDIDLDKEEEEKPDGEAGAGQNEGQEIKLNQISKDANFFMRSFIQLKLDNRYIQSQPQNQQQSLFKTFKFTQTNYLNQLRMNKKTKSKL